MMNTFNFKSLFPSGRTQRLLLFEYSLYATILLTALSIPFLTGQFSEFGWKSLNGWLRLLPFLVIFVVNNYILVPKLLFSEKYLYYILTCILTIITVIYLSYLLFDFIRPDLPFEGMKSMRMPPAGQMPFEPPAFEGFEDVRPPAGKMPPPPFSRLEPPVSFAAGRPIRPFFQFGTLMISILLIGFNSGVKSFVRWSEDKIRQAEKDLQHYHTELALLKHQISPHFFMNTLNNIHALVDINAQDAKNAIIKLSHLMRYLLYESDAQQVSLSKEIDFIESYIELMRLRYDDDNLTIETEYPENMETVSVPSSLFLSFIENAFKHGIHPQNHSLITISFSVEDNRLIFRIVNCRWNISAQQTETTGIGLENVRKRLDLIYRDSYILTIRSFEGIYEVILKIPVS